MKKAKIPVNFIITCYDKEEYLHGMLEIIRGYKNISPQVVVCYNGQLANFPCDVRIDNRGHQLGDIDLTLAGYNHLKNNGVSLFVKLAIDSWLLDDEVILKIFKSMDNDESAYAGNYWFAENDSSLATDIIFANTKHGNIFENFKWDQRYFETSMYSTLLSNNLKASIINDRVPVVPTYRYSCDTLKWSMEHDLKCNLLALWDYNKTNQE